jgi:3-phenylpropionate/trans-cinnamate dioxygenase ferredoxin reductase component
VSALVVGAGLGGLRTAEALRNKGYAGAVTLVGDEHHFPYDRPPLTKQVLTGQRRTTFFDDKSAELGLEVRLGERAVGVDTDARQVRLDGGLALPYDSLVIATGAEPFVPGTMRVRKGLHAIRTVDHAHRLADALRAGDDVTIVGGGFVGCEVASSARQLGRAARIVEATAAPLSAALGERAAEFVARLHAENGVEVITGAPVTGIEGTASVESVALADGQRLAARQVVIALGARPATSWLDGSGLVMDRGAVVCDARGRTSAANVYAVGDAATWWHPLAGRHHHVEHWTTTTEQAVTVASCITLGHDATPELAAPPYFWSDQFGIKIQAIGFVGPAASTEVLRPRGRAVVLYGVDGLLTGVVGFAAAPEVMRMRRLICDRSSFGEALAACGG